MSNHNKGCAEYSSYSAELEYSKVEKFANVYACLSLSFHHGVNLCTKKDLWSISGIILTTFKHLVYCTTNLNEDLAVR